MRISQLIGFTLLMLNGTALLAQTENPFVGKWRLLWEGGTKQRSATLVIDPAGGTWYGNNVSKQNPCVGKSAALEIVSLTADKIVVRAKLSEAQSGCSDAKVVIMRGADGAFSAKHGQNEAKIAKEN